MRTILMAILSTSFFVSNFSLMADDYGRPVDSSARDTNGGAYHVVTSGICKIPDDRSVTIGPNSKYGTGAKAKEKAASVVSGLLGGMLGGSGIGIGAPGSFTGNESASDDGPKTVPDPALGKKFKRLVSTHPGMEHKAGVKAGGTFIMVNNKLAASVRLDKAPSDGTFHAVWLHDGMGRIIFPVKYLIVSLYRNWQLTVLWTKDRWVDGEHVFHDEGRKVSVGTDYLGSVRQKLEGEKGVANSIWYRHGFNTAVKGIKHLVAIFPVTQAELNASKCPMYLVSHISLPGKNPVITTPLMLEVIGINREVVNKSPKPAKKKGSVERESSFSH
ncbi:hypothetical protein BOW39_11425 [Solemya velum gill symbiont]|uniref:hypothetical protein n=1 Tax=Solemya velum gill symbiont TaxID=2340 RepID=UPI000997AACB|nr:hypothetical protein [Solemya velum gill symbiont]OOZ48279.1 hypothetical protein BOW39_11425 [Solemya velum gill symbiont]